MCGFVAQFSKNGRPVDRERIRLMAQEIHHRGPDDEGFLFGDRFGLGFKRLSIIDLSQAGHQPMLDEEKRYGIVYNGELYNYKQLQQELAGKGYRFFSATDTEVVLKAFMEWGPACLQRFIGMFAFIVTDLNDGTAFVARDQLGIKPLYWYQDRESLLFASEVKSFRHYLRFGLNQDALYEQFFFRYVAGTRTIFKDVRRLAPGTYLTIDKNGVVDEQQYYDVLAGLECGPFRTADLQATEQHLQESICMHTQSDVGYNIQLSGGVDSSYITAVLAKEYGQSLHTYSVALDGYDRDESVYQRAVAEQFKTTHHSYSLSGRDLADSFPQATWHMDIPIVHVNCVFLMKLCEQAAKRSKVILTGEGADELFSGYHRYSIPFSERIALRLQRMGLRESAVPGIGRLKKVKSLMSRDFGLDEQKLYHDRRSFSAARELFRDMPERIPCREAVHGRFGDRYRKIAAADQTFYLNSLLERQDKMAMGMSVEARVPYCVWGLYDLVNSFRAEDKIEPAPKSILKKLALRYFESSFAYRTKIGFSLPLGAWLRDGKSMGRYLDLLTDTTFRQRGFYNAAAVARAVDEHRRERRDRFPELMQLVSFEVWHRMFVDGKGVA